MAKSGKGASKVQGPDVRGGKATFGTAQTSRKGSGGSGKGGGKGGMKKGC